MSSTSSSSPSPLQPGPDGKIHVPRRIYTLAGIAEIAAILALIALELAFFYIGYLAFVGGPEFDAMLRSEVITQAMLQDLSVTTRRLTFFVNMIPMAIGMVGLFMAQLLFRGYRKGQIFTTGAAETLTCIGWSVVLLGPAYMLANTLTVLLLTMHSGPGARQLNLSMDEGDVFAIVFGLLIVVVGRILAEAAKIADENKSFV